jgi:hypothetical protein
VSQKFDFRIPTDHNFSLSYLGFTKKEIYFSLTTMQCGLCLGDIPHDYDHSLEPSLEDKGVNSISPLLDVDIRYLTLSQQEKLRKQLESKPNAAEIATAVFLLFVLNATLFILWLVILDSLKGSLFSQDGSSYKNWNAIFRCFAGGFVLGNAYLAYATKKHLRSVVVIFFCCAAGAFWGGIVVETTSHMLQALQKER